MAQTPQQAQPEIRCEADGGKAFAPELTPRQICDAFLLALGDVTVGTRVALRFALNGMASAEVSRLEGSQWQTLPLLEMTVMDRRFNVSDIDRLARNVMVAMAVPAPSGKN